MSVSPALYFDSYLVSPRSFVTMKRGAARALPWILVPVILLLFSQPVGIFGMSTTSPKIDSNSSQSFVPATPNGPRQQVAQSASVSGSSPIGFAALTAAPKVVQTQDYNFRITTHEVTTSSAYVYVTPAGNYSFSTAKPYDMSLTWLNGNQSVSLAAFAVIQGGILTPGASVVAASGKSFDVNSTEQMGGNELGRLNVLYNFSSTPFKATATYTAISKVDFKIVWLVSGGDYVKGSAITSQISKVTGNQTLGNLPYATIAHSSKPSYYVKVDVHDAGLANFVYGKIAFDGQSYSAVAAVFSQNVVRIDPSIVQRTYTGTGWNSCTFSSNWSIGDEIVVQEMRYYVIGAGGPGDVSTPTATGVTFSSVTSGTATFYTLQGIGGTQHAAYAHIYAGKATAASNTVSLASTGQAWPNFDECYDLSGVAATAWNTGSASSSWNYSPSAQTISVGSFTPASGGIVLSMSSFSACDYGTWGSTPSSGFTTYNQVVYGGGDYAGPQDSDSCQYEGSNLWWDVALEADTQYASSWISGLTTASMTGTSPQIQGGTWGNSQGWVEVAASFAPFVTQPLTATLSGSGSTGQIISVSGCETNPTSFSGDGSAHNIVADPACSLTIATPSGYSWQGDGTTEGIQTCTSGTCSGATRNYVVTVTQRLNATLMGSGNMQNITVSGCGANPVRFLGDTSNHDVIVDASCSVTVSLPSGYLFGNQSSGALPSSCVLGFCGILKLFYQKTTPLIAGYVAAVGPNNNYIRQNAVTATVSFRGTPQSDIAAGNWLAAGILVTSFSTVNGRDYGLRAEAILPASGPAYLFAQVGQTCEGHLLFYIYCGTALPSVKVLYTASAFPTFTASDNVTLEMKWSGGTVYWFYQINGGTNTTLTSFTMPSDSKPIFVVGAFSAFGVPAKYFEFGIESPRNLGNTGWRAGVYTPRYYNYSSGWTSVAQANSVMGSNAFIDNGVLWGGQDYTGVSVCYNNNSNCRLSVGYLIFSSSSTTLPDGTRLWG